MLKKFTPAGFPPNNVLSQCAEARLDQRIVFVSGQVGVGPDGSLPADMQSQTRNAVANRNAVLAGAGMGAEDIAKLTIFLTDDANMGDFVEAAGPSLPTPPPAATLVIVKGLASPHMLVEIEAIAVK